VENEQLIGLRIAHQRGRDPVLNRDDGGAHVALLQRVEGNECA